MAGAIKVHGIPTSTATGRVLAALYEKGLQFELVNVKLHEGEHKREPFLSLNVSFQSFPISCFDFFLFGLSVFVDSSFDSSPLVKFLHSKMEI